MNVIIGYLEHNPIWTSLLEVGCTNGETIKQIGLHFNQKVLRGIDTSEEFLDEASMKAQYIISNNNTSFLKTDWTKHEQTYDVVISIKPEYYSELECEPTLDKLLSLAKKYVIIIVDYHVNSESSPPYPTILNRMMNEGKLKSFTHEQLNNTDSLFFLVK